MSNYTIEKKGNQFAVYEIGTYPRSSVLAGQARKSFEDFFDTIEAAKAAYPSAEEGFFEPCNWFDHLPDGDDMESYEMDCLRKEQYDY